MVDIEVRLEQMRGEQLAMSDRLERAMVAQTAAIVSFERKFDQTVRWLVIAVIGSAMGSEGLRIVASVILKGTP